jgi:hypothetical protein
VKLISFHTLARSGPSIPTPDNRWFVLEPNPRFWISVLIGSSPLTPTVGCLGRRILTRSLFCHTMLTVIFMIFTLYFWRRNDGLLAGCPDFDPRKRRVIFLYSEMSLKAIGTTQPPIKGVVEALSQRVKRPRREPNHWISSGVVKHGGATPSLSHMSVWLNA